ncbi:hypothetical protein BX616_002662 [Lobosporangium transversale]|nr:hypothetical protein BX616_002662 [Lobosporangium transversale]
MFRSLLRPSAAVFRTIPASHSVILRHATTTATPTIKPNIKLIAEIRKTIEGVSMMKAKEALIQSDNNLEKALEWVREDEAKSGLVSQIASTALFVVDGSPAIGSGTGDQKGLMQEVPVSDLLQAPILPDPAAATTNAQAQQQELITVQESITKMIAKLSENISLRRCAVVNIPENQRGLVLTGGATHGGENHPITGKLGAISVLTLVSKQGASKKVVPSIAVTTLSRQLTRHLIASPSLTIYQEDCKIPLEISNGGHAPPEEVDAWLDERVLMRQPFVFGGGKVEQVISKIAKEEGLRIKVVDAVRWERGEGMVKAEAADFAEEVRHQLEKK